MEASERTTPSSEEVGGDKMEAGTLMLTSKLATAGRPGPINSHNKKVGADHVVSAM